VTTVYGVESAANENAALLTWQPISSAAGYMVYRGPKNATAITQLTALTTAPQTEPSYLDTNRPDVSFRELQYAVSAVYKAADGSLVEGPVLRLR
jgi:hypothetical protein